MPRSSAATRCCASSSGRRCGDPRRHSGRRAARARNPTDTRSRGFQVRPSGPPWNGGVLSMEKRAIFGERMLPYALLVPQIIITLVFFYWPASQALWQSFLVQDAFGLSTDFVWFENYRELFKQPEYYRALVNTVVFSTAVAALSLSFALLLAVMADKQLRGSGLYRTLLIWPYAVAPAVAGVLWLF